MKKILMVLLILFNCKSFALTYQDVVTSQIKSIFQFIKVSPQSAKQDVPATIGGGIYTTGDGKLGFASTCFKNNTSADKFSKMFASSYNLTADTKIKNLYFFTNSKGWTFLKKVKNCVVTILYFGDPGFTDQSRIPYIQGEINFLSEFDN